VQRFTDDPLTVCPACGGSLRKIFSPVGIVFKGSGFYRTDSRRAPAKTEDAGAKAVKSNGSGEGRADGKKDSAAGQKDSAAGSSGGRKPGGAKASQPAGAGSGG
jgi:predicted nucleic acid-binding Zn ribbon protein